MNKKIIRPYEMSVWTLQDEFITILKSHDVANKGQLVSPSINIKDDGTQELTFNVPMYYRDEGEYKENPLWYDWHNGQVLVNLRKIKVIFNKGDEAHEKVFEFVITDIVETHEGGTLTCEVTASGLAFQELGKIGYKISFSQDNFLTEYEKWFEDYGDQTSPAEPEPRATIDYWCKKVFKDSNWTYSVQMDWSAYDGVVNTTPYRDLSDVGKKERNDGREHSGLRRMDKVYEDDYVASWNEVNGVVIPAELVRFKEKERIVEAEKSNIYNITQTIAETFGVYCRYEYKYDSNYHIIGRECVFYNNYIDDVNGKIDITYPYDASKIEREMDSTDLVTKMFVVPVEDENSSSGLVTIADVTSNMSREDYILNFDYLYQIGSITQEQYEEVYAYEKAMHIINTSLLPIEKHYAQVQAELPEYQAKLKTAQNAQTLDKEQIEQSQALLNSLTDGTGVLQKTNYNPYRGILLPDVQSSGSGYYYIKISQVGVLADTIVVYQSYENGECTNQYTGGFEVRRDGSGNVTAIGNIVPPDDKRTYYLAFSYRPALQYENVYNTYTQKLIQDETLEAEYANKVKQLQDELDILEAEYEAKLEEKEKKVRDFENMMGPAIKEGSWQAESYTDYGNKFNESFNLNSSTTASASGNLEFIWDTKAFTEEQLLYYTESVLETKKYYLAIDLSSCRDAIANNIHNLTYAYTKDGSTQYATVGSQATYAFVKKDDTVIPVFLVTDMNAVSNGVLGVVTVDTTSGKVETVVKTLVSNSRIKFITDLSTYTQVYPRIQVNSLLLKDTEDDLLIQLDGKFLQKYSDYSVLSRGDKYYITPKSSLLVDKPFTEYSFQTSYSLSNAAQAIYFDALEVSKTNAYPQVSYTIGVSSFQEELMAYLYTKLNAIVSINDSELKFDNVRGYISEIDLVLDTPWEDEITIKNYKTKFEDLFSTMVASSEQMRSNGFAYDRAAGAFTSGGYLKQKVLQNTISSVDLDYAFQNGDLTIDEVNGIWARSDTGVVAIAGGGIFCATHRDTQGNWVWNTGITPEGINASMIKTGQLDTNQVRIYAGNNLRFQMNGDGIFAYKDIPTFSNPSKEYIRYNEDGLYFVTTVIDENDLSKQINRVILDWDGLRLYNDKGENVLNASGAGLSLTGNITASEGNIGGWTITSDTLTNKNTTLRSRPLRDAEGNETTDVYNVFEVNGRVYDDTKNQWIENGGVFYVKSDGTVSCTSITTNSIYATTGRIGSIDIGTLERAIKGIKINALTGETFKWASNFVSGNWDEPNDLSFNITSAEVEILPSSWKFFYRVDNETTETEITDDFKSEDGAIVRNFNTSFAIPTFQIRADVFKKKDEAGDLTGEYYSYITIIAKGNTEDGEEYSSEITLYSLFDGKNGTSGTEPKFVQLDPIGFAFVKVKDTENDYLPETLIITATLSGDLNHTEDKGYWTIDKGDGQGEFTPNSQYYPQTVSEDGKTVTITVSSGLPATKQACRVYYNISGHKWTSILWKVADGEKGEKGADGTPGKDGENGSPGQDGKPGPAGKDSVIYQLQAADKMIRKKRNSDSTGYVYSPSTLAIKAVKIEGDTISDAEGKFWVVFYSTDGNNWDNKLTFGDAGGNVCVLTGANLSINVPEIIKNVSGISAFKIALYEDDSETATVLDELVIPIFDDGATGRDGKDAIVYEIRPSVNTIKQIGDTFVPNIITFEAFSSTGGASIPQPYTEGKLAVVPMTEDGSTGLLYEDNGGSIEYAIAGTPANIKCTLYAKDGISVLDTQTVPVLSNGEDGKTFSSFELRPNVNTIHKTSEGKYAPTEIIFTAYKREAEEDAPAEYTGGSIAIFGAEENNEGSFKHITSSATSSSTCSYTLTTEKPYTMIRGCLYSGGRLVAQQTLPIVEDGEKGQQGEKGDAGITPVVMVLSNENTSVIMADTGESTSVYEGCETELTIYQGYDDITSTVITETNLTLSCVNCTVERDETVTDKYIYKLTGIEDKDEPTAYCIFTLNYEGASYVKTFTISVLKNGEQGEQGAPGVSSYTFLLDNEFMQFNAINLGNLTGQSQVCKIGVYKGTEKLVAGTDYTVSFDGESSEAKDGMTATLTENGETLTVSSSESAVDKLSGYFNLRIIIKENNLYFYRKVSYAIHFSATRYYIITDNSSIVSSDEGYSPTTLQFSAHYMKNGSTAPANYTGGLIRAQCYDKDDQPIPGATVDIMPGNYQGFIAVASGSSYIRVELYGDEEATQLYDRQTVPVLTDSASDISVGSKNLLRWTRNMIYRKSGKIVYYEKTADVELVADENEEDVSVLYFINQPSDDETIETEASCNIQGMRIPDVGLNDAYTLSMYVYSEDYDAFANELTLRQYLSDVTNGGIKLYRENKIMVQGALQMSDDYKIRLIEGVPGDGKWQRIAITFYPTFTTDYFNQSNDTSYNINSADVFGLELSTGFSNLKIKKMKLEKGRLATDWTESEFDVDYEEITGTNLLNSDYYTKIYSKATSVVFDVSLEPGYYTLSWNNKNVEAIGIGTKTPVLRSNGYAEGLSPNVKDAMSITFWLENTTSSFVLYTCDDEGEGYYILPELKLQKGQERTGYTMKPEEVRSYYDQYLEAMGGNNEDLKNLIIQVANVDGTIANYTKEEFEKYMEQLEALNNNFVSLQSLYTSLQTTVNGLSPWESYYKLDVGDDNKVSLIIGDKTSNIDLKMKLTSEKLSFLDADNEVAYISNKKLFINFAEIVQQLRIGSGSSTGYLVFKHMNDGLGVTWES